VVVVAVLDDPNLGGEHGAFPQPAVDVAVAPVSVGGGTGETIVQGCALVSLHTAQRGSRGRGRVYLGPITEGKQADGTLVAASQIQTLDAWAAWQENMLSATPSIELGVASYTHADFHPVTSIRVDSIIATQRRRLDQLR